MLLIGGFIIDKFGTKKSILVFALIYLIAAVVTAVQVNFINYGFRTINISVLVQNRLIVAVTTVLQDGLKEKTLSFAFGLNLTMASLGSLAALNSPTWGKSPYLKTGSLHSGLQLLRWCLCCLGVILYFWLMYILQKIIRCQKKAHRIELFELKGLFQFTKSYLVYHCTLRYVLFNSVSISCICNLLFSAGSRIRKRSSVEILTVFLPLSSNDCYSTFWIMGSIKLEKDHCS